MPATLSHRFKPGHTRNELLLNTAAELRKTGKNVNLQISGDPTRYGFYPSKMIQEALKKAVDDLSHMYPAASGWEPKLQEAVAGKERKVHNVNYKPEEIIITPGTTQAITLTFALLLDAGDELLAPEPTYQSYFLQAGYMNASLTTVGCRENENWKVDLDELRKKITRKTKGILINNPNNPTGVIYDRKTVKAICDIAGEHDLAVISDEIYDMLTYEGVHSTSVAEVAGDVPTIVINGPSKCLMIPGWRCGYIAIHDPRGKIRELASNMKLMRNLIGNVATPILVAATKGYQKWDESMRHLNRMKTHLVKARDLTLKRLGEIDGVSVTKPAGTLYAFPKIDQVGKRWKDDVEFVLELGRQQLVLFVPGSFYGGRTGYGHIRVLLLPNLRELDEVYNRLQAFLR